MRERRWTDEPPFKGGSLAAVIVLIVAVLLCGLIVYNGPAFAELLIPFLSPDQQQNMPLIESLFTLVIFGGLLLFAIVGGAFTRVNPFRTGRKPAQSVGIGLLIGLGGIIASALLAWIAGTLSTSDDVPQSLLILLWGAAIIFVQTASEEVYFRGWLQPVLVSRWGKPVGIFVAALAFSALHIMGGARTPITLVNLFLGGILFGFLAAYKGGLMAAIGAHFGWNASEQILLGLDPNPGVGSFGSVLDLDLAGAARWGGSDEGLNASVGMTVALLTLLVPLWIMARARRPMTDRATQPAE